MFVDIGANIGLFTLIAAHQLDIIVSLDGFDAWNSPAQPIRGDSFTIETVNAMIWDDFAQMHDLVEHVKMMKIDVEGWESHVLASGSETLSRVDAPVLQVEFTEQAARSAGSSCEELYHLLEEFGYQMFTYDVRSNRLVPDPLRESYPYLNLIAAKESSIFNFVLFAGKTRVKIRSCFWTTPKRLEQVVARLESHSIWRWLR